MPQTLTEPKERRVGFPCIHGYPVKCEGEEYCSWCELVPQIDEIARHENSGAEPLAMPGSEDE